ncbi:hypothetical protein BBJ28_00000436 [Nothophytophthora sp. Chile5]|nr:hypothetical protein BBJ28_00000436 [Nothophytophthora sp. Chile5]
MLQNERDHADARGSATAVDAESAPGDVILSVQEVSENETFVQPAETSVKSSAEVKKEIATPPTSQTKVLFLDGVRGLAALLVVTQHSHEYMQSVNLGAVAVDAFFVLSSFLLTWLFTKKSMKLLAQGASYRKWAFTLADYFSKRFFRVYPLFALLAVVLWLLPFEDKQRYYLVKESGDFDLYKVLTFDFDHRFFVLWTLPLEISYYFCIPVFVVAVLRMRRFWWIPFLPLYAWVVHEGWFTFRTSHAPLLQHFPTFLAGSTAAVIFVKLDTWIKTTGFQFRAWHTALIRLVEGTVIAVLLSVCFRGLFFDWVHENPAPSTPGFPFISVLLTMVFVIEMIRPSCVSTMFEWSVLRYWGKISFSVYLLHSFVVYAPVISVQPNYFNRAFSRFFLIMVLATLSYYFVEYPSQLLAQKISRALAAQEAKGPGGSVKFTCMERIVASRSSMHKAAM